MKEAKEEREKRKGYSGRRDRRNSPGRYGGRDGYYNRDRRPYGGRSGGSNGRSDSRYGKIGRELVRDSFTGERTERVAAAERRDISWHSVGSGRMTKDPEQAAVSCPVDLGELIDSSHNVNFVEINVDERKSWMS